MCQVTPNSSVSNLLMFKVFSVPQMQKQIILFHIMKAIMGSVDNKSVCVCPKQINVATQLHQRSTVP